MSEYLGYPHEMPGPGESQCEADGVRNGPDGPGGTEYYWTCTAPGTVEADGELLCEDHAGERGHGPKREEYGYDPDDGRKPNPEHDDILEAEVRDQLRDQGLDDDSVAESLSAMRDQGMFDVPDWTP